MLAILLTILFMLPSAVSSPLSMKVCALFFNLGPSPAGLGPPSPHTNTSIDFDPWITPNFTHDEREFIKSQLSQRNNSSLTKATFIDSLPGNHQNETALVYKFQQFGEAWRILQTLSIIEKWTDNVLSWQFNKHLTPAVKEFLNTTNELVKSLKPTKEDGHPHYDRFADAFTEEMDHRLEKLSGTEQRHLNALCDSVDYERLGIEWFLEFIDRVELAPDQQH